MNSTADDQDLPTLSVILFVCSKVANLITMASMGVLFIFLIKEFMKPESLLKSGYFYLIALGCGLDTFSGFAYWMLTTIEMESFFYKFFQNYHDWYYIYAVAFWQLLLSLNRATAVSFPWKHQQFWTSNRLIIGIIVMVLFPVLLRFNVSISDECRFDQRSGNCAVLHTDQKRLSVYVILVLAVLSVIFITIAVGFARYKKYQIIQKTEHQMVIQALLAAFFLIAYAISQYISAYYHDCTQVNACQQFELFSEIMFCAYHFPVIQSLFIFSGTFRKSFIDFIRCSSSNQSVKLKRQRLSSSSTISAHSVTVF